MNKHMQEEIRGSNAGMGLYIQVRTTVTSKRASINVGREAGICLLRSTVILLASLASFHARATDVFYAGIAYLGDHQFIEASYPLSRKLNEPDGTLDRALRDRLQNNPGTQLNLQYGLADLNRAESIVLAVAIDQERVVREVFNFDSGLQTKLIVEISLQLLFYDYASNTLIANQPVSAAMNHVIPGNVNNISLHAEQLAEQLYMDPEHGLLHKVQTILHTYSLDHAKPLRFQLTQIDLHDRVLPHLPEGLSAVRWQQSLGQFFSAQLSQQTGVEVIPYNRGYALANQLPGRFANGDVFGLALPDPDLSFAIQVKQLSRYEVQGNLVYGSQISFEFAEPFTGTTFVDGDYRLAVYKLGSEARVLGDDWSAWQDALQELMTALIKQLRNPQKTWHTEHARDKRSYRLFNKKKGLFNE